MNKVQQLTHPLTPPDLSLDLGLEQIVISDLTEPLSLGGFVDNVTSPFIAQMGQDEQKHSETTEVSGSEKLGSNLLNTIDGNVVHAEPSNQYTLATLLRRPNQDGVIHDFKNFLARPFAIDQGVFSSTDTANTFGFWSCFNAMSNANMFVSKLRGAYMVRATTHVTLEVNANRMQQGRYLLCYMPTGGMKVTLAGNPAFKAFYRMHRYSRVETTQLMHANLDVNCDTQASLTIPYVSNTPGWSFSDANPTDSNGDPGVFFITPYYSLVAIAGSGTASYTMYVHYTDVEVDGVGVAQAGKVRKRGDKLQAETFSDRPISQTLNTISTISKGLINIPFLSGIASVSAVVSDALAGAAYTLGWSRPLMIQPFHRMHKEPHPYLSVADAHDYSDNFALTIGNSVGVVGGLGGNDLDELTIDFLKTKSVFFNEFAWPAAAVAGTVLGAIAVSPVTANGSSDTKNSLNSWTTINYLSKLYSQWRGSIIYTFKFCKTEFHSGRLVVRFIPFDDIAYGNPGVTVNNKPYMLKTVIDLREQNEISIRVPYLYSRHWTDTQGNGKNAIGSLTIEVLDPLVAPATVSSTITCGLEIAGGEDMQFAIPYCTPASTSVLTAPNDLRTLFPTEPFILQSGTVEGRSDCSMGSDVIGGANIRPANFAVAAACTGEISTSLRQIMKRGAIIPYRNLGGTSNQVSISPRIISTGTSVTGTVQGFPTNDPFNYISMLYHSMRGSVRIKTLPLFGGTPGEHTIITSLHVRPYGSALPVRDFVSSAGSSVNAWIVNTTGALQFNRVSEGGAAIQIPQYSRNTALNVGDQFQSTTLLAPDLNTTDKTSLNVFVGGSAGTGTNVPEIYFHRSIGDDFNLAGFVSIPCTSTY